MLKIGDVITALGVVACIFIVLELVIGWKMIPEPYVYFAIPVALAVVLIGMIVRNIGKAKAAKAAKKDAEEK